MKQYFSGALCALLLLATPALSASLYSKAATTPPDKIQALCDEIIARQDKGKVGMPDAGELYFWGKLMGKPCIKADPVKAITLLQKAGDTATANAFIRVLRERAASGNPAAISALNKLHLSL